MKIHIEREPCEEGEAEVAAREWRVGWTIELIYRVETSSGGFFLELNCCDAVSNCFIAPHIKCYFTYNPPTNRITLGENAATRFHLVSRHVPSSFNRLHNSQKSLNSNLYNINNKYNTICNILLIYITDQKIYNRVKNNTTKFIQSFAKEMIEAWRIIGEKYDRKYRSIR